MSAKDNDTSMFFTGCNVKTRKNWCDHLVSANLREGLTRGPSLKQVLKIPVSKKRRNQMENRKSGQKKARNQVCKSVEMDI